MQLTKAQQAYEALEQMIIFEDLKPGTMQSVSTLMEQTGFGRTPILQALQRLAQERMVEVHPNKGILIPPTSIEAQLKLLELRRVLECFTVALAARRAGAQQRDAMQQIVAQLEGEAPSPRAFAGILRHIHAVTVEAASNEYLSVAMAPLQGLSRRFWFAHLTDPLTDIKAACEHHGEVLRAIIADDPDGAEEASLRHNDYLVRFAYATLGNHSRPTGRGPMA
jgi:DNA-binding GntR family transcriptional regulator